jgi:hypothetical protein
VRNAFLGCGRLDALFTVPSRSTVVTTGLGLRLSKQEILGIRSGMRISLADWRRCCSHFLSVSEDAPVVNGSAAIASLFRLGRPQTGWREPRSPKLWIRTGMTFVSTSGWYGRGSMPGFNDACSDCLETVKIPEVVRDPADYLDLGCAC